MKFVALFPVTALCAAFMLASCADTQPQPPAGIPAELREIIEANRAIAFPDFHPDFHDIASSLLTQDFDAETFENVSDILRRMRSQNLVNQHTVYDAADLDAYITRAEAAWEIRFLFDLLKHAYAGYQYFGGDGVFLPLRDSMLEQLAQMPDPLQVSSYLRSVLFPAFFGAVTDFHFVINGMGIARRQYWPHICEDFTLRRRNGDNFVVEIDGAAYNVIKTKAACGKPVDGILPTLTREGEFAWAFGRFASVNDLGVEEMSAVLENAATGERRVLPVSLPRLPLYFPSSEPMFETRMEGDVMVVVNRTLRGAGSREQFFRLGLDLQNEPALVLDLRGHRGGNAELARAWVDGFTRRWPRHDIMLNRFSLESSIAAILHGGTALPEEAVMPAWVPRDFSQISFSVIPNDNLVIVLTDNRVGSAGDMFVGFLRQLENALFVGTNTQGALVTSRFPTITLPYSGIVIQFGTCLHLRPDLSQFEGRGFMPDLWVPPGESLERVLAFIERYGLNR